MNGGCKIVLSYDGKNTDVGGKRMNNKSRSLNVDEEIELNSKKVTKRVKIVADVEVTEDFDIDDIVFCKKVEEGQNEMWLPKADDFEVIEYIETEVI